MWRACTANGNDNTAGSHQTTIKVASFGHIFDIIMNVSPIRAHYIVRLKKEYRGTYFHKIFVVFRLCDEPDDRAKETGSFGT